MIMNNDNEASTLLLHSSLRDCSGMIMLMMAMAIMMIMAMMKMIMAMMMMMVTMMKMKMAMMKMMMAMMKIKMAMIKMMMAIMKMIALISMMKMMMSMMKMMALMAVRPSNDGCGRRLTKKVVHWGSMELLCTASTYYTFTPAMHTLLQMHTFHHTALKNTDT